MKKQPRISPPVGYNIQREPRKAQFPYFCILAGQEAKMPCNECSDHKRCVPGTMRYKEQANMEYEEKAVVQVDDKGELLKCAKEYGTSDCGFKAGTKVCGKCGAMPTAVKMVPLDEDVDEEKAMLKQPPMIPEEEEEELPEVAPEEAPAPEAPPAPRLAPPEEAPPAPAPAPEAPPAPRLAPPEEAPAPEAPAPEAPPAPAPGRVLTRPSSPPAPRSRRTGSRCCPSPPSRLPLPPPPVLHHLQVPLIYGLFHMIGHQHQKSLLK